MGKFLMVAVVLFGFSSSAYCANFVNSMDNKDVISNLPPSDQYEEACSKAQDTLNKDKIIFWQTVGAFTSLMVHGSSNIELLKSTVADSLGNYREDVKTVGNICNLSKEQKVYYLNGLIRADEEFIMCNAYK